MPKADALAVLEDGPSEDGDEDEQPMDADEMRHELGLALFGAEVEEHVEGEEDDLGEEDSGSELGDPEGEELDDDGFEVDIVEEVDVVEVAQPIIRCQAKLRKTIEKVVRAAVTEHASLVSDAKRRAENQRGLGGDAVVSLVRTSEDTMKFVWW